ncbi:hypothetical protein ABK040_009502 [Willaertia magna]
MISFSSTNYTSSNNKNSNNKKGNNNRKNNNNKNNDQTNNIKTYKSTKEPAKQRGTGLHLDSWPYNLWGKLRHNFTFAPLDRFRPFQSMVCLTDGNPNRKLKEGGLELIPGFHAICEKYFPLNDIKLRGNDTSNNLRTKNPWISSYHLRFNQEEDKHLKYFIRKVQRIPEDWKAPSASTTLCNITTVDDCINHVKLIGKEHDSLTYVPVQKGDFILFDIREPHQNSDANDMKTARSVFYHAYLVKHQCNEKTINDLKERRKTLDHPNDFNSKFSNMEKKLISTDGVEELDTELSKLLFNEKEWTNKVIEKDSEIDKILTKYDGVLTERHIQFYHRFGYVVVENAVELSECDDLLKELLESSTKLGCPLDKMDQLTSDEWHNIGGDFGAMCEFYWLKGQQNIRKSEKLYTITVKLLSNTWCCKQDNLWNVPYKCPLIDEVNPKCLWLYIDRLNYRLPEK